MQPNFSITVEDKVITDIIKNRLVSLKVTDEAGIKSDTVELTLDDRDLVLEIPKTGVKLKVHSVIMNLVEMGTYIIDEVTVESPPSLITIKGYATNSLLSSQHSNGWHEKTIGELVAAIASKHNLQPRISSKFANIPLSHLDQTIESDMNLLTRLAQIYGAIAKPAGGFLLFVEESSAKSYTGQTIGGKTLTPQDVSNWRISFIEQKKYKSVIATWHDSGRAKLIEEKAGEGKPAYRLRTPYPNAQTARAAAAAKLQRLNQDATTLSITLRGDPELTAESKFCLSGFKQGIPARLGYYPCGAHIRCKRLPHHYRSHTIF